MNRTKLGLAGVGLGLGLLALGSVASSPPADPVAEATQRLTYEIQNRGRAYSDLQELVRIGHRLTGSPGAAQAVEWARRKMESYGLDRVWLQPMKAPRWERGTKEAASALSGGRTVPLQVAALGGSVGTEGRVLEAEVVEFQSLAEAEKLGQVLRGKILFFNRQMRASSNPFKEYGNTAGIRYGAATVAQKCGALAAVIRSLSTLPDDDHPHTGVMDMSAQVPAAALSTRGANELSRLLKADPRLRLRLELSARRMSPVDSFNVIGELAGRDLPDEHVVIGGHLDSWDLSHGAHDDGAGVVQTIEALRAMKELGLRPRRSVRAVLFMSEEVGGAGAEAYLAEAKRLRERPIAAIESDSGGFAPIGIGVAAGDGVLSRVKSWKAYFAGVADLSIIKGYSGADVEPLAEIGAATFGLTPDPTHYFDLHHSALDTIDRVVPAELHGGAAVMSVFAYLAAELGMQP